MDYKENGGVDPITMRQGFKRLDDVAPDRKRDDLLQTNINLSETNQGGFLGRDVSPDSESSKL